MSASANSVEPLKNTSAVQCLQKVFTPLFHMLLCYKVGLKIDLIVICLSMIYTKYSNVKVEEELYHL